MKVTNGIKTIEVTKDQFALLNKTIWKPAPEAPKEVKEAMTPEPAPEAPKEVKEPAKRGRKPKAK